MKKAQKVPVLGEEILEAKEMARVEGLAISEFGEEKGAEYMEQAGEGLTQKILSLLAELGRQDFRVVLLCGPGNNGGDAFVCGMKLHEKGVKVKAISLEPEKKASKLCLLYRKKFSELVGSVENSLGDLLLSEKTVVLDGLFGTGFKRELSDNYRALIQKVNDSEARVFSLDIPSGLSEESLLKKEKDLIIEAEKTFFLGLSKTVFFFRNALDYCGELEKVDFGLEEKYKDKAESSFDLLSKESFQRASFPKRQRTTHKHKQGQCSVWAGSEGMLGAGLLASKAAYRTGAGLVRLFLSSHNESVACALPELITEKFFFSKISEMLERINSSGACLIGPGIGLEAEKEVFFKDLCSKVKVPLVLDADALTFYSKESFPLPEGVIMTPHLGELQRLLDLKEKPEMTDSFVLSLQDYVEEKKVTLVVKGAPTFILSPGKKIQVYAGGDSGMATAGSGDVLAGILVSYLAQGLGPWEAACLGVFCHGESGSLMAKYLSSPSLMAGDLVEGIPFVNKSFGL